MRTFSRPAVVVTERDVHHEFFSSPPQILDVLREQGNVHPAPAEPNSETKSVTNSIADHFRFAGALIRTQLPSNFAKLRKPRQISQLTPGLLTVRQAAQAIWGDTKTLSARMCVPRARRERSASSATCSPRKRKQSGVGSLSYLNDVLVGLSVGAMSIPQGMSYALLAGLSYQHGLYNNLVHPIIYFLFGTSLHAVTGVSAVENLMIGESLTSLVGPQASVELRHNASILLSLLCGVSFLIFYGCKLAVMADLLADPVLSGFTTAAAFLVGTSQLKHAFGLKDLKSEWGIPKAWLYIVTHLDLIMWPSVSLCLISVLLLYACKYGSTRIKAPWLLPGPLVLVISGCLASYLLDFASSQTIRTVGSVPSGLPGPIGWPSCTLVGDSGTPEKPLLRFVLIEAAKLSALFFIIHISIAKSISLRQNYQVNFPQELLAFSATNFFGAVFQCYPTCTSISRSAVAEGSGAKSGIQGPTASLMVLLTLLYLTKMLELLPMPCLAAVVFVGVSHMTEFHELARLWSLQKASWQASEQGKGGSSPDLLLWCIAFVITVCLGATEGILVSITLSLVWIGKSILRPRIMELGRLPGTMIYRDVNRFPGEVEIDPHIAIFRIDAPLNFCNAGFLQRQVQTILENRYGLKNTEGCPPILSGEGLDLNPLQTTVSEMSRIRPRNFNGHWQSTSARRAQHHNREFLVNRLSSGKLDRVEDDVEWDECSVSPSAGASQSRQEGWPEANSPPVVASEQPYVELTTTGSGLDCKNEGKEELSDIQDPVVDCGRSSSRIRIEEEKVVPNIFILDCSSINGLDITAIGAIKRIVCHASLLGVIVAFSNWKGPQRDFLFRADFYSVVPPQRCFLSNHDAYLWACAFQSACGRKWRRDSDWLGETDSIKSGLDECSQGLGAFVSNTRVVHEKSGRLSREWEVSVE